MPTKSSFFKWRERERAAVNYCEQRAHLSKWRERETGSRVNHCQHWLVECAQRSEKKTVAVLTVSSSQILAATDQVASELLKQLLLLVKQVQQLKRATSGSTLQRKASRVSENAQQVAHVSQNGQKAVMKPWAEWMLFKIKWKQLQIRLSAWVSRAADWRNNSDSKPMWPINQITGRSTPLSKQQKRENKERLCRSCTRNKESCTTIKTSQHTSA